MARIVIVTHEFDLFFYRKGSPQAPVHGRYMLYDVLRLLEPFGHDYALTRGPNPIPGDVAILHVDSTVVPAEYLALRAQYPRTLNFGTADISKRAISRHLLAPGDDWPGPVIVKSNLNCNGTGEAIHNVRALAAGRPEPHPNLAKGMSPELV